MNKKIIFYFLTALVVLIFKIDSSHSIPTIPKYDENYWTSEKMKNAKLLTTKNTGFRTRSGVETIKNRTDTSGDTEFTRPPEPPVGRIEDFDQNKAIPIGKLFMSKNGDDFACTASVINTDSGNIGITAAHCLYDQNTQSYFDNVMFSPGYDNGQEGPLGTIPIARMVVPNEFLRNNNNNPFETDKFDWGMVLFNFNQDGHPLKFFTGNLGYILQRGNNIPTTIRGYPNEGVLENCPNDGETLCTWQGVITLTNDFYVVQDIELGEGASGSPLMANYDPNTNLGTLYSNYASYDEINDQLLAPLYDSITFYALISDLEH